MVHMPASARALACHPVPQKEWRETFADNQTCGDGHTQENAHRIRIFSRARASTGSTSYFCVGHANIMCRKREA